MRPSKDIFYSFIFYLFWLFIYDVMLSMCAYLLHFVKSELEVGCVLDLKNLLSLTSH